MITKLSLGPFAYHRWADQISCIVLPPQCSGPCIENTATRLFGQVDRTAILNDAQWLVACVRATVAPLRVQWHNWHVVPPIWYICPWFPHRVAVHQRFGPRICTSSRGLLVWNYWQKYWLIRVETIPKRPHHRTVASILESQEFHQCVPTCQRRRLEQCMTPHKKLPTVREPLAVRLACSWLKTVVGPSKNFKVAPAHLCIFCCFASNHAMICFSDEGFELWTFSG